MRAPHKGSFRAGENHLGAKLSDAQVSELRRRAHAEPLAALAREFRISPGHTHEIVHQQRRANPRDAPPPRSPPDVSLARFFAKVQKTDSCWLWCGDLGEGRARCYFRGRRRYARDAAYELLVGDIPEGRTPNPRCGNPRCVRPEHMELAPRWCRHRRGPAHPRWRGGTCTS